MATIRRREFLHSHLYEVQIRRKGIRSLTVSFATEEEAKQWGKENEFKYLESPEKYRRQIEEYRLIAKWHREKGRAG